ERQRLRALRLPAHARFVARAADRAAARGRHRDRERLLGDVAGRAIRWRETERLRARGWSGRDRGVRPPEERGVRLAPERATKPHALPIRCAAWPHPPV